MITTYFCQWPQNVRVGYGSGSVIIWPSGSVIQDFGPKDPDPKEIIKDPQHLKQAGRCSRWYLILEIIKIKILTILWEKGNKKPKWRQKIRVNWNWFHEVSNGTVFQGTIRDMYIKIPWRLPFWRAYHRRHSTSCPGALPPPPPPLALVPPPAHDAPRLFPVPPLMSTTPRNCPHTGLQYFMLHTVLLFRNHSASRRPFRSGSVV